MQMGGSDQWGNIVSGVDLVRRVTGNSVHGITLPLLLDQNGKKMGKTEKGALWLNESFTSPYAFYQYWLNRPDQNCASLLNKLSFVSMEKISTLLEGLSQGTREAQKVLAEDLTIQVHGRENFERALKASESLFGKGDPKSLDSKAFRWLSNEIPSFTLKKEDFQSQKAMDLMALTELSKSKGQAKKDISQGALSVNGEKIMDPFFLLSNLNPVGDNFFLLKKGKKNFCLLEIAC